MTKSKPIAELGCRVLRDDSEVRHSDLVIRHFAEGGSKVPIADVIGRIWLAVGTGGEDIEAAFVLRAGLAVVVGVAPGIEGELLELAFLDEGERVATMWEVGASVFHGGWRDGGLFVGGGVGVRGGGGLAEPCSI